MNEQELRRLIAAVKTGRQSRRSFVQTMVGLGLTAPFATQLLIHAGLAQTPAKTEYKPTKAGGGGALSMLFWQGPTLLNPHFAIGTKDQEGSRIFYEPLAAWDPDGNLSPVLAAEIPDIENGGVAPDGMSVIWKLKKDVQWHDGRPFTADDVVFNAEYAGDPATAAVTIGNYQGVKVEKVDLLTVRVHFAEPTPFWANAFVGSRGMIIPKHLFEPYKGANSREAPGEPEADRNRSLSVCRLPTGRSGQGRAPPGLPRGQPPVFRQHRDEGRRRCRIGGARRNSDRRIRLCMEYAGRG